MRISGESLLWQKERLLNLGIQALPDNCGFVAFLDTDLVVEDEDWPEQGFTALAPNPIIQPFCEVCHLPPTIQSGAFLGESQEPDYTSHGMSLGQALSEDADLDGQLGPMIHNLAHRSRALLQRDEGSQACRELEDINAFSTFPIAAPGLAWCCRRDTLNTIGTIPDRYIGGGGDLFATLGLLGRGDDLLAACSDAGFSNVDHSAYRQFCRSMVPLTMAALPQRVFHWHHGDFRNRRYVGRHADLQWLNSNLDTSIGIDHSGMLCFQGPRKEFLEQHMRACFQARMDDESPSASSDS